MSGTVNLHVSLSSLVLGEKGKNRLTSSMMLVLVWAETRGGCGASFRMADTALCQTSVSSLAQWGPDF